MCSTSITKIMLAAFVAVGCDANGLADPEGVSATHGEIGFNASTDPSYPAVIPLPTGFQPEGIAVGPGHTFYVGSILSGAVYKGDLRTGEGGVLVPPAPGARMSVGLSFDGRSNLLFAAGGFTGAGFVYDAETGALVAAYPFATPGASLVNDVIVIRRAAYFTNSFQPVLYRVPLGPAGQLPDPPQFQEIPLSGDFQSVSQCPIGFPAPVNANGIDAAPNGEYLILVNLCLGTLYRVEPGTGAAALIDLGGATVPFGDGILLDGFDLYVVQNLLNQIAMIRLNPQIDAGVLTSFITDPSLRVPATIAEFGNALYAVNARFDVAPPDQPAPGVEFEVVRVLKK